MTASVVVHLPESSPFSSDSSPLYVKENLPDFTHLVLEAIGSAENLSWRTDCESTLFSALLNEIISLPHYTVMLILGSVRPELARVFLDQ